MSSTSCLLIPDSALLTPYSLLLTPDPPAVSAALFIAPDIIRHHRLCGFVHCPVCHAGSSASPLHFSPDSLFLTLDSLLLIPYSKFFFKNICIYHFILLLLQSLTLPRYIESQSKVNRKSNVSQSKVKRKSILFLSGGTARITEIPV